MIDKLQIPQNLHEIIEEEGQWQDDSLYPILITVMDFEYKGVDIIGFEMEFPSSEELGKVNELIENLGIEMDGYRWEFIIRQYIQSKNSELEENIYSDSELENCVLWVKSKEDFLELIKLVLQIAEGPQEVNDIIQNMSRKI